MCMVSIGLSTLSQTPLSMTVQSTNKQRQNPKWKEARIKPIRFLYSLRKKEHLWYTCGIYSLIYHIEVDIDI